MHRFGSFSTNPKPFLVGPEGYSSGFLSKTKQSFIDLALTIRANL
jgi:hypothetical protein